MSLNILSHINNEFIRTLGFSMIFCFALNYLIIKFWLKLSLKLNINKYVGDQRAHSQETSRFGGVIIFLGFLLFITISRIFYETKYLFLEAMVLSSLPIILITIKEDLYQNTSFYIRLIASGLAAFAFLVTTQIALPQIEVFLLSDIVHYTPLTSKIFFVICLITLINGMNFIDGLNGLMSFTALVQLGALILVANNQADYEVISLALIPFGLIIIFLVFNFPKGKLFAGDVGAYFMGFYIGIVAIYFFGRHESLSSWIAVAILFYPCMEVIFSFFRKKYFDSTSPFLPDKYHLHSKMYYLLRNVNLTSLRANNLATVFLFIIWGLPLFISQFFYESTLLNFLFVVTFIIIYLSLYSSLPRINDKKHIK